jgi:hypothetical protein
MILAALCIEICNAGKVSFRSDHINDCFRNRIRRTNKRSPAGKPSVSCGRPAYAVLVGVDLLLTLTADIFEIISYASQAFAAYYGIQATIAALSARAGGNKGKCLLFATLAVLGCAITIFGDAVE